MIFLRFKIETLEYYFAKYLINKGLKSVVQIPLSPLVNSQNLTKPFKSYDLEGFLISDLSKLFKVSHFKGVLFGVL